MNVARASYTTANWLLGAQIVLRLWANKSQRGLKGARNAPSFWNRLPLSFDLIHGKLLPDSVDNTFLAEA